jgi:hypothetical protein
MPMEFLHGRPLSPEELGMILRELESLDHIGAVDDEIRGIVARNWPHLPAKLRPEDWIGLTPSGFAHSACSDLGRCVAAITDSA